MSHVYLHMLVARYPARALAGIQNACANPRMTLVPQMSIKYEEYCTQLDGSADARESVSANEAAGD